GSFAAAGVARGVRPGGPAARLTRCPAGRSSTGPGRRGRDVAVGCGSSPARACPGRFPWVRAGNRLPAYRRRGYDGVGDRRSVMDERRERLLVICGPTATGKTDLAIALARHIGSEIVNA